MAAPTRKIHQVLVSKIPWTVGPSELKQYFMQFGTVRNCRLPFDQDTGFHRGFGWIVFTTEDGLSNTLQTDPHVIDGSKVVVQRTIKTYLGTKANKEDEDI